MNERHFVLREDCPACRSKTKSPKLYSASFTEPPVSTYLQEFYSGRVEFDYLKDANFVIDECKECGLIYQRLIPNEFLMSKLYEEWINPERICNSISNNRRIEYYTQLGREIEMCIRHFGVMPCELELFDFGMGWGEWSHTAKAYGCSVFGTELSQARIDYAIKSGLSVIGWEEIAEHQFDFINTEQVFEHIANPLETLRYLCKSLKTIGIIKISVPNGWDIKRRLAIMNWTAPKGSKNSLNPIAPLEHINCFSQVSLVRMAQIAGLVPVQICTQIQIGKRLLDYTLRDILRPYYHMIINARYSQKVGSTYLFFQKI